MNKTEDNALNKRLAELLGWEWQGYTLEETSYDEILMDEYETPKKYFTPSTDMAQSAQLAINFGLQVDYQKPYSASKMLEMELIYASGNTPMEAIVRAIIKLLESENG